VAVASTAAAAGVRRAVIAVCCVFVANGAVVGAWAVGLLARQVAVADQA
jgi:hypothetical protein